MTTAATVFGHMPLGIRHRGRGRGAQQHRHHAGDGITIGTLFILPAVPVIGREQDGPVELTMLYVPFDTFTPIVDEERYRCLKRRSLYSYEAVDLSFSADLPVDPDGLVTDYPDMFERAVIAS
jgi:Putative glycolipid-binding